MPKRPKQKLVAIPNPAPSIPRQFRLFHGGAPKGNYLVPMQPDSELYLGDFVYFSPVKQYAAGFMRKRGKPASRLRGAKLYIVDARYLPPGSRVITACGAITRPCILEDRFFEMIDINFALAHWDQELRTKGCPSTYALPDFLEEMLRNVHPAFCRSDYPQDPAAVSVDALRKLEQLLRRYTKTPPPTLRVDSAMVEKYADLPLAHNDRFSSLTLFLLQQFGTLDLTCEQLRAARALYRRAWLNTFTVPFRNPDLDSIRQQGVVSVQKNLRSARNGLIVMIPGPIPVLPKERAAGRTNNAKRRRADRLRK